MEFKNPRTPKSTFVHGELKFVPYQTSLGAIQEDVHICFKGAVALFTPRVLTGFDVSVEKIGSGVQPSMM